MSATQDDASLVPLLGEARCLLCGGPYAKGASWQWVCTGCGQRVGEWVGVTGEDLAWLWAMVAQAVLLAWAVRVNRWAEADWTTFMPALES